MISKLVLFNDYVKVVTRLYEIAIGISQFDICLPLTFDITRRNKIQTCG